jgi:hypothetical protein
MTNAFQAILKGDLNSRDYNHNFRNLPLFKLSTGINNRQFLRRIKIKYKGTRWDLIGVHKRCLRHADYK